MPQTRDPVLRNWVWHWNHQNGSLLETGPNLRWIAGNIRPLKNPSKSGASQDFHLSIISPAISIAQLPPASLICRARCAIREVTSIRISWTKYRTNSESKAKKSLTMSKSPTNHPTNPNKLVKHSKKKVHINTQHLNSKRQIEKKKKTKLISTWNGSSPPCCSAVAKFPKVQLKDFWAALVDRVNQWELPIGAGLESMTSPGQSLDESS